MAPLKFAVTTIMALILFAASASAEQASVLGTWKSDRVSVLRTSDGKVVPSASEVTLVFEAQNEQLIQGYKHWRDLNNQTGNVAGKEVRQAKEPFIGSVSANGRIVRMVETEDHGLMWARMVSEDKLQVTYIEPYPHATTWTAEFRRVDN